MDPDLRGVAGGSLGPATAVAPSLQLHLERDQSAANSQWGGRSILTQLRFTSANASLYPASAVRREKIWRLTNGHDVITCNSTALALF